MTGQRRDYMVGGYCSGEFVRWLNTFETSFIDVQLDYISLWATSQGLAQASVE
jgi:hypothetical protein